MLQVPFGHGGVVFQCHALHTIAFIEIPHRADKTRRGAEFAVQPGPAFLVMRQSLPGIESLFTDLDMHAHPPVTGGKKATSSPSLTG